MSHNITERDGLFVVRDAAWHQLGTVLPDYPTPEEARQLAHPWEPVTEPVFQRVPYITDDGIPAERFEEIPGQQAVVRSDTSEVLGVTTDSYTPVLNAEMYEIAEALESTARGSLPVKIETAGSLKGGRKVWLLLRLEEPVPTPGDPDGATIPYYALQNAHDGSAAFRGQATMTRIVCDNTASLADFESTRNGTSFAFRHTVSVTERIEEAKLSLAGWREGLAHWSEMVDQMTKVKITKDQRSAFVETFIPLPVTTELISPRVETNVRNARAELVDIFNGPTQTHIAGTAYGLVQGAVEWSQHYRRTRGASVRQRSENLFKRAYLDDSQLVRVAQDLALEASKF